MRLPDNGLIHNVVWGLYVTACLTARAARFILVTRFGSTLPPVPKPVFWRIGMANAAWSKIVTGFASWFGPVFGLLSPKIREEIVKFITSLEEKAAATPNPWDDIGVAVLKAVFGIK